jgi:2-C-methyl-D-erythritol 4-phosphate cytidylyltransferase/2-C-methyl-D-erythritol 2,4-cyclodiphosphate synthase
MRVAAIIAAGGRGVRLGAGQPKQLLLVGGRPMLERSVEPFINSSRIDEIVVVLPPEMAIEPPPYLRHVSKPLAVVAGGDRRQDSVAAGFDAIAERADVVVVHDAARPFVTVDLIGRTVDAAIESGAAIAALAAQDTVKEVRHADGAMRVVQRTLPRDAIVLVQTPQAFRAGILRDAVALGRSGVEATDEAALAERAGHPVRVVEGDPRNVKITTPDELELARRLAEAGASGASARPARVGTGYDLHRLVAGRRLILGGVAIPFPRGLAGHSDADVLCHAVIDAVLGAAAAGDIGRHFPDTDGRWKDASSLDLLTRAADLVRSRGFVVENIDAVVIAERPIIAPHVSEMTARMAGALGVSGSSVSVKGKTHEGLGEVGRGEAIAAHAVALLRFCG